MHCMTDMLGTEEGGMYLPRELQGTQQRALLTCGLSRRSILRQTWEGKESLRSLIVQALHSSGECTHGAA